MVGGLGGLVVIHDTSNRIQLGYLRLDTTPVLLLLWEKTFDINPSWISALRDG